MTFRDKLEILRGEPIRVYAGDPLDIPCVETSDPDRLCRHPVVSVHMLTYNHESYIRQAIEGVMMQKTDFEFELVIGEDCSTDRTREICFAYQKRHPDRIRVLWSDRNLCQNPHPAGENDRRTSARCRGEFIAFCEGDDYWVDPLKLQKQVAILREHPEVNLVCAQSGCIRNGTLLPMPAALPDRIENYFHNALRFGTQYVRTATTLCRASVLRKLQRDTELGAYDLRAKDFFCWAGLAGYSDRVYRMGETVAVYRQHPGGITAEPHMFLRLEGDNSVTRCYLMVHFGLFDPAEALRVSSHIAAVRRVFCEEQLIGKVEAATWAAFDKSLIDVASDTAKIRRWLLPFYRVALKVHRGYPSHDRLLRIFTENNLPLSPDERGGQPLDLLQKLFPMGS